MVWGISLIKEVWKLWVLQLLGAFGQFRVSGFPLHDPGAMDAPGRQKYVKTRPKTPKSHDVTHFGAPGTPYVPLLCSS